MNKYNQNFIKKSLYSNQVLGGVLILAYCIVYGITAQIVLSGLQLMFFLSSVIFALTTFYVKDLGLQKEKAKKGILFNQTIGTMLVIMYILAYGISSISLLNGFQLIFFMSSFTFAMSIFYLRDPERIKKEEDVSCSNTSNPFVEKNPCLINSKDLSWLIRELNSPLSTIIGFGELMLQREYSEREKEYMIRNIYENALSMSNTINKVSCTIIDSPTRPKEIHKVIDLLSDKNFK